MPLLGYLFCDSIQIDGFDLQQFVILSVFMGLVFIAQHLWVIFFRLFRIYGHILQKFFRTYGYTCYFSKVKKQYYDVSSLSRIYERESTEKFVTSSKKRSHPPVCRKSLTSEVSGGKQSIAKKASMLEEPSDYLKIWQMISQNRSAEFQTSKSIASLLAELSKFR